MINTIRTITFVFLSLFMSLKPVMADDETLEVITIDYPPYSYMENGELKGINTAIVREVFDRLGVDYEIKILPWSRGIQLLQAGQVDAVFNPYKLKDRLEWLDFPNEPLIKEVITLVTLKGAYDSYEGNLDIFINQSIATIRSFAVGKELNDYFEKGKVKRVESDSVSSLLKMVQYQRVAAGAIDVNVAKDVAMSEGVRKLLNFQNPPIQIFDTYLAFSKKKNHQDLLPLVDATLKQMRSEGFIDRQINQYFLVTAQKF